MQFAKIELAFELDITVGSGTDAIDLVLSASIIPGSGFLMFSIAAHDGTSIEQVFSLMAGKSWETLIPAPLQYALDDIKFQGFLATFFIGSPTPGTSIPSFELTSIAVSIGSNPQRPISLFGPFKEFAYRFIWTITNPTNTQNQSSMANFFAEVTTEVGTFDVEIIT